LIGGPLAAGGGSHGTTGTMVNPALGLVSLMVNLAIDGGGVVVDDDDDDDYDESIVL